ncbi:hypothetical protein CONLIGDRAFT_638208 [Coniochaeta ligniaria NRRL 30616]|uniref:Uncharacterized protein n=1 Tax=Coniochaeta ligniaria NRRL 30616 TaxID=1408157 RepID=A0A1J7I5F0_9PEZI|nr:hypothetical protein CONLIGDRAFT_638208 [Coniochaeta ligniaria NRRL 30616]
MDSLRATVAAQASTIEEQGNHITEMRQQMCKLSEEEDTTLSKGRNGLWSKGSDGQWGKDNGPLWTPQR